MIRAVAKGSMLFAFGRLPGGAGLYRKLTRARLGTQATHVDKLARVWPGYADVWQSRGGASLEGADIWFHDAGWTPFPFLLTYLYTGKGGTILNSAAEILPRYLEHALETARSLPLSGSCRIERQLALREFKGDLPALIEFVGANIVSGASDHCPSLPPESIDVCHSGGTLEHFQPNELRPFLGQAFKILRPGGLMSHIFDHRDHLYHADKAYPFLGHLRLSDPAYALVFGHRLLYHSRLLPAQVAEIFEEAGFEKIALRRLVLPSQKYFESDLPEDALVGLPRHKLAKRFQAATDDDLRTAAAHYLFRKPASRSAGALTRSGTFD